MQRSLSPCRLQDVGMTTLDQWAALIVSSQTLACHQLMKTAGYHGVA